MKLFSIALVAGARPDFMQIAPIMRALQARKVDAADLGGDLRVSIVHSGQNTSTKNVGGLIQESCDSEEGPSRGSIM